MKVERTQTARKPRRTIVVGVFDDLFLVDLAVSELSKAGFDENQIVVALGRCRNGGCTDGTVAAAPATAVDAGLVGVLAGAGMPEHEARYYQDELEAGRAIVTVSAHRRAPQARAILRRHGSYDMLSGILSPEVTR
jgi:hypothetical protein